MNTTVEILGKKWQFSDRIEWGALKGFFDMIREKEGDVFADFERFIGMIPEAERAKIFRERQERRDQLKSLNLASPIAKQYLQTLDGVGYMALAMLRPNHPDVTLDQALAVMQALDPKIAAEIRDRAEAANKSRAKNASAPAA